MNAPIRRLSVIIAMLFVALLISTTYIQGVAAKSINGMAGNRRTLLSSYNRERGSILIDGQAVARSVPSKDELKWARVYAHPTRYAHVTGYYSFVYGAGGGIEDTGAGIPPEIVNKIWAQAIGCSIAGSRTCSRANPPSVQASN